MRPPRLRCTLFPLIYPPHLLCSYKWQLYGFVFYSRLTKRNLALYVISIRRTKSLPTASFRFHLTMDTLAVQLYTSLLPRRVQDFHPLERAHGAQTAKKLRILSEAFYAAERIRTPDTLVRSQVLYPAELLPPIMNLRKTIRNSGYCTIYDILCQD